MSLPMHLAIVPDKVSLNASSLTTVAAALSKQVERDFSPIWNVTATVDSFATLADVPTDYWPIIVTHYPAGGGYHETKNGQPYAIVNFDDQWNLTASHECLEMLADPFGQRTVAGDLLDQAVALGAEPQRVLYLVEICDPSESGQFAYQVNGVTVSDFYTPHYFDPQAAAGVRYSFGGSINAPRVVLDGGYISWQNLSDGQWWQLRMFQDEFSQQVPHLVNLSQQTNFEKIKRQENIRAAIDSVTRHPQYKAGLSGHSLQRSVASAQQSHRRAPPASLNCALPWPDWLRPAPSRSATSKPTWMRLPTRQPTTSAAVHMGGSGKQNTTRSLTARCRK